MLPERVTRIKAMMAMTMTVIAFFYFLTTLPEMQKSVYIAPIRQVFLALGWKTDWRMFAPSPRRTFPTTLTIRSYNLAGDSLPEQVIFDFHHIPAPSLFIGPQRTHWSLFYLRLWNHTDCLYNCERFLDEWVRRHDAANGEAVARVEMVWTESRVPDLADQFTPIKEVPHLKKKEVIGFKKNYDR